MIPSLLNTIKQNGLNSFVSLFIGLTTSSTSPYSEKYAEYKSWCPWIPGQGSPKASVGFEMSHYLGWYHQ